MRLIVIVKIRQFDIYRRESNQAVNFGMVRRRRVSPAPSPLGVALSFRTLLCIIFKSAACLPVSERSDRTKFQSEDIWLRTTTSASSLCAASGHPSWPLPRGPVVRKIPSREPTGRPLAETPRITELAPDNKSCKATSVLGQTRTFSLVAVMSALPSIATKQRTSKQVRDVPEGDIAEAIQHSVPHHISRSVPEPA